MEALPSLTSKPYLSHLLHRHHHRPTVSGPPSSVFFKTPPSPSTFSIKASKSDSHSSSSSSSSPFSLLKLPICVAVATAALFATRLSPFRPLPALAGPPVAETLTSEAQNDAVPSKDERKEAEVERFLEEKLASNPSDVESLKTLLEIKMRARKLPEVVEIATTMSQLEPDEVEWRLLRGHTYCYMGDYESAKPVFEEIIANDPNRVEAYHGLVMSATQLDHDDGKELGQVEKRIDEAIQRLKRENKKVEMRDFYLLIAQIRVIQGEYLAALNVYQDLVREEPRDYRPYLCQGIIYTLLRKKKEAEEQFQKYKRLVPKEHPYAEYFEDNVKNTAKVFSEAAEK